MTERLETQPKEPKEPTYQYKSMKKRKTKTKKINTIKRALGDRDELYKGLKKMLGRK